MSRLIAAAMWIGVATRYGLDSPRIYLNNPLSCDRGDGKCYSEAMEPWVALPVREYGIRWECGDVMLLFYEGGEISRLRALDTGPFGKHCVMQLDGTCPAIVADVPNYHFPFYPDLSRLVTMVNLSHLEREIGCSESESEEWLRRRGVESLGAFLESWSNGPEYVLWPMPPVEPTATRKFHSSPSLMR